jgi:CBS domain-containing protein
MVREPEVAMTARTTSPTTHLRDLTTSPPITIDAAASLRQAAAAMREHNISCVLVGRGRGFTVCTERDVTDAIAEGRSPRTAVSRVHGASPRTIDAEATVQDAAVLMLHYGVRHLVVVHDDEVVGVVSIRDALDALARVGSPVLATALHEALTTRPDCWLG